MPKKYRPEHVEFIRAASQVVGIGGVITLQRAIEISLQCRAGYPLWLLNNKEYRAGVNLYRLPVLSLGILDDYILWGK